MARRRNTEETRRALLASARAVFTEVGYAAAGTEEIVARTGLTRGALYHHFADKRGLFRAVLEDIQTELAAEVDRRARSTKGDTMERLRAGFHAYLDVALRDDVRRILLVDGPAVLGWDEWNEIDRQYAYGATRAALQRAMASGELADAPLDELTHVLLGAVTQAGLELGRSSRPRAARRSYGTVLDLVLDRLRARP
jgi:AcrR family transcriptional regulator